MKKPFLPHILYEDNHLLVVEKPANLLSQGDETGDPDLLTLLKEDLKERYQKPGNVYLGLVHRLDRPVGGVMVFAKTSKAAARLSEQVRQHLFKKTYLAVVYGKPEPSAAVLKHFLVKDQASNTVKVVKGPTFEAKEAILNYIVVAEKERLSLVRIHLQTGRSHQIRVQMAAIGHPLFGDQKYGADRAEPGQPIALWAMEVEFFHPITKEIVKFRLPPPTQYPWNYFICNQPVF